MPPVPRRHRRFSGTVAALLAAVAALLAAVAAPSFAADRAAGDDRASGTVLVFGGTGRLGSEIVRALVGAGFEVSVFARASSDRQRLEGLPVSFVTGDALQDADVRRALEARRYRVVVNALGRSESPPSFFATTGASIARWARATGVEQVIFHSSVGAGDSRAAMGTPRWPSLAAVYDAKEAAESALTTSGVHYTIIRNARLQDPTAPMAENPRLVADPRAIGTVSRRGLAKLTVECTARARCYDHVYHAVDDSLAGL